MCTETILQQGLVKVRCIVWNTKCFLWRSIYLSSLACAFLHTFLHFEIFLFSSGCYVIFASHVGYCSLGYFGIVRILFTNEKIPLASLATRLSCQHVFQLSSICCIGEKLDYIVEAFIHWSRYGSFMQLQLFLKTKTWESLVYVPI